MNETLIIACPLCAQLNRVPREKLQIGGNCGKCKAAITSTSPMQLEQNTFTNHIVKSELPVLVDFWAPWCGPCKMMGPILEEAAVALSPNVRVAKINTETEQNLAAQFNIRSIPTLAIFFKGKEMKRVAGAMPLAQLIQWTQQTLSEINH